MSNHDDIARRWAKVAARQTNKELLASKRANVNASGDRILSYGWWEMARLLRDRKGQPERFLVNGDTYSNTTSKHQASVRNAIAATGLPSVIIPYSAIESASIGRDSITLLEALPDHWETTVHHSADFPEGAVWEYHTARLPGTGLWIHEETGEEIDMLDYHSGGHTLRDRRVRAAAPRLESDNWESHQAKIEAERAKWIEVPAVYRNTGYKTLAASARSQRWGENWELIADDTTATGYSYTRTTQRHRLGESLVMATVYAPNGKTRRARFLSGFDRNETRQSYFFCELPRTSKALTVEEALEDLKPSTVKTAESIGRKVERQGDIFAVPMPTIDTRSLSKRGAERVKAGTLLNTNHVATEVATVGKLTFARGTLKHAPANRRPDHARIKLGDGKQWHLITKNTVPITA